MAQLIYKIDGSMIFADRADKDNAGNQISTTYAPQSNTYTKAEVDSLIGSVEGIHFVIVAELPTVGETNIIYLKGPIGTGADKYEEWIYNQSQWKKIGDTSVDLSNYATKTELNAKQDALTTQQLANIAAVPGKQDALTATQLANIDDVPNKQDALTSAQLANIDAVPNKQDALTSTQLENIAAVPSKANSTDVAAALELKQDQLEFTFITL